MVNRVVAAAFVVAGLLFLLPPNATAQRLLETSSSCPVVGATAVAPLFAVPDVVAQPLADWQVLGELPRNVSIDFCVVDGTQRVTTVATLEACLAASEERVIPLVSAPDGNSTNSSSTNSPSPPTGANSSTVSRRSTTTDGTAPGDESLLVEYTAFSQACRSALLVRGVRGDSCSGAVLSVNSTAVLTATVAVAFADAVQLPAEVCGTPYCGSNANAVTLSSTLPGCQCECTEGFTGTRCATVAATPSEGAPPTLAARTAVRAVSPPCASFASLGPSEPVVATTFGASNETFARRFTASSTSPSLGRLGRSLAAGAPILLAARDLTTSLDARRDTNESRVLVGASPPAFDPDARGYAFGGSASAASTASPVAGGVSVAGVAGSALDPGKLHDDDSGLTATLWFRNQGNASTQGILVAVSQSWLRRAETTGETTFPVLEEVQRVFGQTTALDQRTAATFLGDAHELGLAVIVDSSRAQIGAVFSVRDSVQDAVAVRWTNTEVFDGSWHFLAIRLGVERGRQSARLFLNGGTSWRDRDSRTCIDGGRGPDNQLAPPRLDAASSAVGEFVSAESAIEDMITTGGSFILGHSLSAATAFDLYGVQVHAGALSHDEITELGTAAMRDLSATEDLDHTVLGAVTAVASFVGLAAIAVYYVTVIGPAGGGEAINMRVVNRKIEAVVPAFLAVAQGLNLLFSSVEFPPLFQGPTSTAFFVFSLEVGVVSGSSDARLITAAAMFAVAIVVVIVLALIARTDNAEFMSSVIAGKAPSSDHAAADDTAGAEGNNAPAAVAADDGDTSIPRPVAFPPPRHAFSLVPFDKDGAPSAKDAMRLCEDANDVVSSLLAELQKECGANDSALDGLGMPNEFLLPLELASRSTAGTYDALDGSGKFVTLTNLRLRRAANEEEHKAALLADAEFVRGVIVDKTAADDQENTNVAYVRGVLKVHLRTKRCPLHDRHLTPWLEEFHGLAALRPDGSDPYQCAMRANGPFTRVTATRCTDSLATCPEDGCGFTVCLRCVPCDSDPTRESPSAGTKIMLLVQQQLYVARKSSVTKVLGSIALMLANALYLPVVTGAVAYLTCHPTVLCELPDCFSTELTPTLLAVIILAPIALVVVGFVYVALQVYMCAVRKLAIVNSGLWAEHLLPPGGGEASESRGNENQQADGSATSPPSAATGDDVESPSSAKGGSSSASPTNQNRDEKSGSSSPVNPLAAAGGNDDDGGGADGAAEGRSRSKSPDPADPATKSASPPVEGDAAAAEGGSSGRSPTNEAAPDVLADGDEDFNGDGGRSPSAADASKKAAFFVPKTMYEKLFCGMSPAAWEDILLRDSSLLQNVYAINDFRAMAYAPIAQLLKLAAVCAVLLPIPGSFTLLAAACGVEFVSAVFVSATNQLTDPWLNLLHRAVGIHQLLQIALLSFHRVVVGVPREQGSDQGLAPVMLTVTILFFVLVLAIVVKTIVLPHLRWRKQHAAEQEALQEQRVAQRAAAADAQARKDVQALCVDTLRDPGQSSREELQRRVVAGLLQWDSEEFKVERAQRDPAEVLLDALRAVWAKSREAKQKAASGEHGAAQEATDGEGALGGTLRRNVIPMTSTPAEVEMWEGLTDELEAYTPLKTIRLHNSLDASHYRPLAALLKTYNTVTCLDLSYHRSLPLGQVLPKVAGAPALESLVLRGVRTEPVMSMDLASGFEALYKTTPTLTAIDFSENILWNSTKVKGTSVKSFFECLKGVDAGGAKVSKLTLERMLPPAAGISFKAAVTHFFQRDATIKTLSIAGCHHENVGQALVAMLASAGATSRVEHLDINGTTTKDATAIVSLLKKVKSLKSLNAARNPIDDFAAVQSIVAAASSSKRIELLNVSQCVMLAPDDTMQLMAVAASPDLAKAAASAAPSGDGATVAGEDGGAADKSNEDALDSTQSNLASTLADMSSTLNATLASTMGGLAATISAGGGGDGSREVDFRLELDDADMMPLAEFSDLAGRVNVPRNVRVSLAGITPSAEWPVTELKLQGKNRVNTYEFAHLSKQALGNLTRLSISRNPVGKKFAHALAAILREGFLGCMTSLELNRCDIPGDGLVELAGALPWQRLRELRLGGNAASEGFFAAVGRGIMTGDGTLPLDGTALAVGSSAGLATCELRVLDLSNMTTGKQASRNTLAKGGKSGGGGAAATSSLKRGGAANQSMRGAKGLASLKGAALKATVSASLKPAMYDSFSTALLLAIARSPFLKHVGLAGLGINGNAHGSLLADTFTNPEHPLEIEVLDVRGNSKLGVQVAGELLRHSKPSLKVLDIGGCGLGPWESSGDASPISGGLKAAKSLTALGLSNNAIERIDVLFDAIVDHPALAHLDLALNPLVDLQNIARIVTRPQCQLLSVSATQHSVPSRGDDPGEVLSDIVRGGRRIEYVNVQADQTESTARVQEADLTRADVERSTLKCVAWDMGEKARRKRNLQLLGQMLAYSPTIQTFAIADRADVQHASWLRAANQNSIMQRFTHFDRATIEPGVLRLMDAHARRAAPLSNEAERPFEAIEQRNQCIGSLVDYVHDSVSRGGGIVGGGTSSASPAATEGDLSSSAPPPPASEEPGAGTDPQQQQPATSPNDDEDLSKDGVRRRLLRYLLHPEDVKVIVGADDEAGDQAASGGAAPSATKSMRRAPSMVPSKKDAPMRRRASMVSLASPNSSKSAAAAGGKDDTTSSMTDPLATTSSETAAASGSPAEDGGNKKGMPARKRSSSMVSLGGGDDGAAATSDPAASTDDPLAGIGTTVVADVDHGDSGSDADGPAAGGSRAGSRRGSAANLLAQATTVRTPAATLLGATLAGREATRQELQRRLQMVAWGHERKSS